MPTDAMQYEAEAKEFLKKGNWFPRYKYWAGMSHWELEEALALTIDLEPRAMEERSFPLNVKRYIMSRISEVRESIRREWLGITIKPIYFVKWAEKHYIDFPKELAELIYPLDPYKKQLTEKLPERPLEKPFGTRERQTLLEIILGMAVDKYGYDASNPNKKSNVPKAIQDSLYNAKISNPPTPETIRKKLLEAVGLPEDN